MFSPGAGGSLKNLKDLMRMTCFQIQYFPLPGRKAWMEGGAGARSLQRWGDSRSLETQESLPLWKEERR